MNRRRNRDKRLQRLTLITAVPGTGKWLAKCTCGVVKLVVGASVRNGDTRSCGCLRREVSRAGTKPRLAAHVGLHVGSRVVIGVGHRDKHGKRLVTTRCKCGFVARVGESKFMRGRSNACASCGQLERRRRNK